MCNILARESSWKLHSLEKFKDGWRVPPTPRTEGQWDESWLSKLRQVMKLRGLTAARMFVSTYPACGENYLKGMGLGGGLSEGQAS